MRSNHLLPIFWMATVASTALNVDARQENETKLKALVPKMAPARISKPLIGRLEQIVKPGATLPVAATRGSVLTATATANLPPRPPLISPDDFVGKWGGNLKITKRTIAVPDPAESRFDQNETGKLVLDVVKDQRKSVIIKPAIIFFPGGYTTNKENLLIRRSGHFGPLETVQLQMLARLRPDDRVNFTYRYLPTDFCKTQNPSGDNWRDATTDITLSMPSKQTYEQDIVVKRTKNGKLYGYTESVIQMTHLNQNVLQVNIARAEYTPERKLKILTVLDGTLDKSWEATATSIGKLTGSDWQKTVDTLGKKI